MIRTEFLDLLGSDTLGDRLAALRAIAERGMRGYRGRVEPLSEEESGEVNMDMWIVHLAIEEGGIFEAIGKRHTQRILLTMLEAFLPRFREFYPQDAAYGRALWRLRRTMRGRFNAGPLLPLYDESDMPRSYAMAILDAQLLEVARAVSYLQAAWVEYVGHRSLAEGTVSVPLHRYPPAVLIHYEKLAEVLDRISKRALPRLAGKPVPPLWFVQAELTNMFGLKEYTEIVRALVERGVDVNATRAHETTALDTLGGAGYEELVRLLLAKGARVNNPRFGGSVALVRAVYAGRENLVALLLAHGAREGERSEGSDSLLTVARKRGYKGIARMLEESLGAIPRSGATDHTAG